VPEPSELISPYATACPVCVAGPGDLCLGELAGLIHADRAKTLYLYASARPLCDECGRNAGDHTPPTGQFSVQTFAALAQHGIDPHTGHTLECSRSES
jgi:hypothetical protein